MNLNPKQKIEITHDILAREVYARIDAEEKMRLKVTQFLLDRYDYYLEAGDLLDKEDLAYVAPYLEKVQIGPEQVGFIEESRRKVKAHEWRRRRRNLFIGSMLAIAAVVSILFAIRANDKTKQAEAALAVAERAKEDAIKANEATTEALEVAEQQRKIAITEKVRSEALSVEAQIARDQALAEKSRSDQLSVEAQIARDQALGEKARSEALSVKAEMARDLALAEKARSDSLSVEAQIARGQTETALDDLKKTTTQIFDVVLKSANEDILNLDYEGALEKIKNAANLNIDNEKAGKALIEIIYFFNEAGRYHLVIGLADDLKPLLGGSELSLDQDTLASVRAYLKNLNDDRYTFLKNRYFPEMVVVPGGTFKGKKIAGFRMAKYETTNWQYLLYCLHSGQDNMERTRAGWPLQGNMPVVNVSWKDAIQYSNWLNGHWASKNPYSETSVGKEWQEPSKGYRLPSKAEWGYAIRGGPNQVTYRYSGSDDIEEVAWYWNNSNGRPHPAGEKKANDLGLFDMSGNVWEWCLNEKGTGHAFRGGSYFNKAMFCKVSNLFYIIPGFRYYITGFRMAGSLK